MKRHNYMARHKKDALRANNSLAERKKSIEHTNKKRA